MKKGFTLIELLIVVLIIGVLTAIALPQYQTATDKSRYATLMPMAKSVASAQEAYYMNDGHYSEDLAYLDVQLPNDPSGTVANIGDGLKVEISEDTDYEYVKMSKEGLENNYIIYQDNSNHFPKEIHCEALSGSSRAERLCKTLGGTKIEGGITPGYETYVLEGAGTDLFASAAGTDPTEPNDPIEPEQGGVDGCDSYPCVKECTGALSGWVAQLLGATPSCKATYQEDGSFVETACIEGEGCLIADYTEDGMDGLMCDETATICPVSGHADANGNITSYRSCQDSLNMGVDGTCASYDHGYDRTYDKNGNEKSYRRCYSFDAEGNCNGYDSGMDYDYTYYNETGYEIDYDCTMDNGDCVGYSWGVLYRNLSWQEPNTYTWESIASCVEWNGKTCASWCSANDSTQCSSSYTDFMQ